MFQIKAVDLSEIYILYYITNNVHDQAFIKSL